jgi:hypothetical protein
MLSVLRLNKILISPLIAIRHGIPPLMLPGYYEAGDRFIQARAVMLKRRLGANF